jgi:hypothetical protein
MKKMIRAENEMTEMSSYDEMNLSGIEGGEKELFSFSTLYIIGASSYPSIRRNGC